MAFRGTVREEMRAFVGMTAFEALCRQWVAQQSRAGHLPFEAEDVGSHWSRGVQVDVVAVNWREKALLLGECKWGTDVVGRDVIRELIEEKTPKVVQTLPETGKAWQVHYAFFARAGFTEAARIEAEAHGAMLVDLARLDTDFQQTSKGWASDFRRP